jgi:hypothetical protein
MEALNRLAGPPSARSEMAEVLLLAAVSLFPLAQLRHSTPDLLLSGVPLLLLLGAGLHPPRGVSNSDLREWGFYYKQCCGFIRFWWIRSMSLTNGSGSGSGSYYFHHCPSPCAMDSALTMR